MPPTKPTTFDFDSSAAAAPTRKLPSSSRNLSPARFVGMGSGLPAASNGGE